jgi:hypothetical protein
MTRSELKKLISETIQEMAKTPKRKAPVRKAKAASKGYTLKPNPDPIMDGEMELRVKGKVVAVLWTDESGDGTNYMLFPSENEYGGTTGSIEEVAKWIVDHEAWT